MIKVSVLYPQGPSTRFDAEYYLGKHVPMVKGVLGPALKGVSVELGLAGGDPGSSPTYVAMGHLLFDSVEAFQAAFGPHAEKVMADIPNYTNVKPTLQLSEVRL